MPLHHVRKLIHKTHAKVLQWRYDLKKRKSRLTTPTVTIEPPPAQGEHVIVHLSMSSVAKATLVVIFLYVGMEFIYSIREILVLFFVALLLSAALDPTIDYLEKKKIPRGFGIIFLYLVAFFVIGFFISKLVPLVAEQTLELARHIGDLIKNLTTNQKSDIPFFDKLRPLIERFLASVDEETLTQNLQIALENIGGQLKNIAGNTFTAIQVVFNGIFNAVLVLVLAFFMTINEKCIERFFVSIFPSRYEKYIMVKTHAIKQGVGAWLRGQLLLCFIIGLMTYIGLLILGVPYAATLAMIAGLFELIPYVGPFLSAVPAILIALNISPWMALWVVVAYFIIQEMENNVVVPLVMKSAVGINPIIIFFALLVGFQFLGVLGMILAIPVATIVSIFVKDFTSRDR